MEFELMKEQLTGAYREIFEAVQAYGIIKNISWDVMSDRLTELYDILLTAQTEGKEVRRVAGDDRERFCKDIFQDYTVWDRIKRLFESVYTMAWVIFILELLTVMAAGDGWKEVATNVLPYLLGVGGSVILALVGELVIAPVMLKSRKVKPGTWSMILLVATTVLFALAVIIGVKLSLPQFEAPALWLVVAAGVYIAAYWITRSIRRYRNYGTIRNVRKQMLKDSYYKSLSNARLERTVLRSWKGQYARLTAKGKTASEDFLLRLKKSVKMEEKVNIGLDIFIGVFYAGNVIHQAFVDKKIGDILLFALLTGILTFMVWRLISRTFREGTAVKKKLIAQCEASGLGTPDFIEQELSADTDM